MGIQARVVPCGYQVSKSASLPSNPVYPEGCNQIPGNWQDKRPWK